MLLNENDIECEINYNKKRLVIFITYNYYYYINSYNRYSYDNPSSTYNEVIDHINEYFEIG